MSGEKVYNIVEFYFSIGFINNEIPPYDRCQDSWQACLNMQKTGSVLKKEPNWLGGNRLFSLGCTGTFSYRILCILDDYYVQWVFYRHKYNRKWHNRIILLNVNVRDSDDSSCFLSTSSGMDRWTTDVLCTVHEMFINMLKDEVLSEHIWQQKRRQEQQEQES